MKNIPIYSQNAEYAREHGELDAYRASGKADVACKKAIEEAIREHYHDNRLDDAGVKQVADAFGYDRMLRVLANTVREKDWDGRISRENKAWAQTVHIVPNPDAWGLNRNVYFVVESHPGLTDLFVTQARKQYALEREKPQKKDSVLEKLQRPKPSVSEKTNPTKRNEKEI